MKLPVLMYHGIDPRPSVVTIHPQVFARQMRWLHDSGVRVIALTELIRILRARQPLPARCAVLTFDDGFAGLYQHAFPVLQEYGFPATVFLVADSIGGDNRWPGQPMDIPAFPLLDCTQILELSRCQVEFGSHTLTHPHLDQTSPERLGQEIQASRAALEARLGIPIETFAYPYGRYNETALRLVQETYLGACSTELGFASESTDPYQIERVDAYYLQSYPVFVRLFSPALAGYLTFRKLGRRARAIVMS